jgi:hypothetical protein
MSVIERMRREVENNASRYSQGEPRIRKFLMILSFIGLEFEYTYFYRENSIDTGPQLSL